MLASLVALLVTGCSGRSALPEIERTAPRPVILDVDMAHEDMTAALFLLQHPNIEVRAITVVGTGEAHCGPGVENALGLLRLVDGPDIPVACGPETPLPGGHAFPDAWRADADRAYGVQLPQGGQASSLSAPQLMVEVLMTSDERVSIIAVGPLTNVATALQARPAIAGQIEAIYVMGGAVEVEGNVGNSGANIDNRHAEWNIYADPAAANVVFASGVPVTLVPLDATRDVPVTRRFYNTLGKDADSPAASFVHELLGANLAFVDNGGFQFWDSFTAALFTDASLAKFQQVRLQVVEQEGPESGYTKPADGGPVVRVAVSADRQRFERLLVAVLDGQAQ
jgi:inosine-uridine nucleoside N-ribohydrolase